MWYYFALNRVLSISALCFGVLMATIALVISKYKNRLIVGIICFLIDCVIIGFGFLSINVIISVLMVVFNAVLPYKRKEKIDIKDNKTVCPNCGTVNVNRHYCKKCKTTFNYIK